MVIGLFVVALSGFTVHDTPALESGVPDGHPLTVIADES
jgi:hypothetical protein